MTKRAQAIFYSAVCLVLGGAFALPAQAIPLNDVKNTATNSGIAAYDSFQELLVLTLRALLVVSFTLAVIFVVISGFRMVTSQGNEDKLEAAKRSLYWAILGIIVIGSAWFVLSFIVETVKTGNV